jgi:hypothetical protein
VYYLISKKLLGKKKNLNFEGFRLYTL